MLSDKQSVLQLAALLHAHGVRHAVLCPGSRSAPIVHTLLECGLFTCHRVTDERSAAFVALGLAQHGGAPAAVVCTSGTALLNMHPAVAEAFYQQVPLVVVSADRPAAWIGQQDGQTLPQPHVFGTLARRSVDVLEIHDETSAWHANRLINEALLECRHRVSGPVHINMPISEPLYQFTTPQLPRVRTIARCTALPRALPARTMLVCGQLPAPLAAPQGCLCVAENLSNSRGIRRIDELVDDASLPAPQLVVTLGGHILSKKLKEYLRRNRVEHWHVCPDGTVADTFCTLTHVLEMQPADFLRALPPCEDAAFADAWKRAEDALPAPECEHDLALAATRAAMELLQPGDTLQLANSSAVRFAQRFPLPDGVRVRCNRGTSGIEGSLSTAVGCAAACAPARCLCLIGDLSFFYDMNALWNAVERDNLRIVLLNNGGGRIFDTLPGMPAEGASHDAIAGGHAQSAQAWAQSCGLAYISASTHTELPAAVQALSAATRATLLEILC